jgi:hypothetical protein
MKNLDSPPISQGSPQSLEALPADYISWSAAAKQDFLWQQILKTRYQQLPPLKKIDVVGLFLTALRTKMDNQSDQAPPNWKKAIHAHASVAKIKFFPAGNLATQASFTGLFKGADYGLLRASLTADPSDRGLAPGIAIKFCVSGAPSENVSALVSLTGQGQNYNFFAHEFSNIVPVVNEIGPKLINLIFRRVSRFPTKLYLQGLGQVDQQGRVEATPRYPTQIFLVPNPNLRFSEQPGHDFRDDLATIPAGSSLFLVYAVDPNQLPDGQKREQAGDRQRALCIGEIETTSEFVASSYGDNRLFFRHQRFRNQ